VQTPDAGKVEQRKQEVPSAEGAAEHEGTLERLLGAVLQVRLQAKVVQDGGDEWNIRVAQLRLEILIWQALKIAPVVRREPFTALLQEEPQQRRFAVAAISVKEEDLLRRRLFVERRGKAPQIPITVGK